MLYDWNTEKARANEAKHGVSFEIVADFDWDAAIHFLDDAHDEERWIAISFIGLVLHVMVYAESGETIRIIGLRRATKHEQKRYAEETG